MYRQFTEIVSESLGSDLPTPSTPSEITRSAWIAIADTYDPLALRPIWRYTTQVLKHRPDLNDPELMEAVAFALATTQSYSCDEVLPELAEHFDFGDEPATWHDVQVGIEAIATAWEKLGQ